MVTHMLHEIVGGSPPATQNAYRNEELAAVERQISEIYAMIDHFIVLKERGVNYASQEIKDWRKQLQIAKKVKRRILNT